MKYQRLLLLISLYFVQIYAEGNGVVPQQTFYKLVGIWCIACPAMYLSIIAILLAALYHCIEIYFIQFLRIIQYNCCEMKKERGNISLKNATAGVSPSTGAVL